MIPWSLAGLLNSGEVVKYVLHSGDIVTSHVPDQGMHSAHATDYAPMLSDLKSTRAAHFSPAL